MSIIDTRFSVEHPICAAEGRYGDVYITQGGVRPSRWTGDPDKPCTDAGIDAPVNPPSIELDPDPAFYVARTDVQKPGAVYYAPPEVTYSFENRKVPVLDGDGNPVLDEDGNPTFEEIPVSPNFREAKAKAYLEQAALNEIEQVEEGKYYPTPPTISLSETHGKGAELEAILDCEPNFIEDEDNSTIDGITFYAQKGSGPPWQDEAGTALPSEASPTWYPLFPFAILPIERNGIFNYCCPTRYFGSNFDQCVDEEPYAPDYPYQQCGTYEVRGLEESLENGASGAKLMITGAGFLATCYNPEDGDPNDFYDRWYEFYGPYSVGSLQAYTFGTGYSAEDNIFVRIFPGGTYDFENREMIGCPGNTEAREDRCNFKSIVVKAYVGNEPSNPNSVGCELKSIRIVNGGEGYLVAPELKIVSETGFGAYATCTVKDGKIDTVTIENKGGGYKSPPTIEILAGGAEAFGVARPHMRGLYQCYYRYTDDTPEDRGGPVPSNLSPVLELEAGEYATGCTWQIEPSLQTDRVTHVELWRSTSGQATTMYRVARIPIDEFPEDGYFDDFTDAEIRDPDRKQGDYEIYAAMPILLPNGEINAMRFVPPPEDKQVVVKFQDRMWYGIGGELENAVYYSETDEPESVPEENEVIIQQNDRDADALHAMIPFGSTLFLAQERHLFSLNFSQIPLLDGQISPVAFRGCINQRCWVIHEDYAYIADHYGIYRMSMGGGVEPLSDAVFDEFEYNIDWRYSKWNFMSVDFESKTLRLFVVHKEDLQPDYDVHSDIDGEVYPTRALCFDILSKAFWWEKYPTPIASSSQSNVANEDYKTLYGGASGVYALSEGDVDMARGAILTATVTKRGSGYVVPPKVQTDSGFGGKLQAVIDEEGKLNSIWIFNPGYGHSPGPLIIEPSPTGDNAEGIITASSISEDQPLWPTFHFKTGNIEFPTDEMDSKAGGEQRRDVKLTYKPVSARLQETESDGETTVEYCGNELSVRFYYNDSDYPRYNVSTRDRGIGFVDSTVDPASRLDIAYMTYEYGADNGVARAIHTGKTLEDIRSNDRHVAIEVCGPRRNGKPVVLYTLDVFGGGS